MRILLIEIDYDIRLITSEFLKDSGCEVETAATSAMARKLLGQTFDLVLIDHYTYKAFNLEPELFHDGKNVLILSSFNHPEESFKFLPNCKILKKPFNIDDLRFFCKIH